MADRYQWLSAEKRVRVGTLEAASTWHSYIRPESPLWTLGRALLEVARDGRGMWAQVYGLGAVGSQWK